jgi:DNA invertase Pin-like site-specific DNA recombinase
MTNSPAYLRAVIYVRYSSHSQRDVSIEQQIRACRRFAERQDIEILDVYEDRALTGTSDKRPGFQKMIRDAAHGEWDYVIVYTLDRFARDRYDSAVYKRQLKNHGVKVLSAMENISDDPTGVLMESLLEGLAEYYSKELSQKIRRGMEDNARKCLVNGSLPLGYVRGADGRYAICEEEAEIVREAFRRVAAGEKFLQIFEDFNSRGLLTKKGKAWNKSSFNKMLTNERYIGIYIYGDVRIPGGIPAIVTQDQFDAVTNRLGNKANARISAAPQRRRQENGTYLLTGKLFCGHCKSPMVGVSGHSKAGSPYYYYVCKGKRGGSGCEKANVRRESIEQHIATALRDTMLTDDAIRDLADAAVRYQAQSPAVAEADALRHRLAQIKSSTDNLISAMEAGIFTAATRDRLLELESEQRKVSAQLSSLQADLEHQLTREEIIATLELFQDGDVSDKSYQESLIDTFLVAAYVYDDTLRIVFHLNGSDKDLTVPFNIDDLSFSDTSTVSPQLHQTLLYEHFGITVLMIGDLFVFERKL